MMAAAKRLISLSVILLSLALVAAEPVYKLLGKKGLGTAEMPPMETALVNGDVAFRQHSGGHTNGPNWPTFLAFASRYLDSKARR